MIDRLPVLIVDDDPAILGIMKHLVQRAGADAILTDSGEKALDLVAASPFSAVFVDYQMPRILGPDLLKRIAAIQPDASRIIMTGMPSLEAVLRAVNEGEIYRFVTKPWVREEMTATIRSAIDRFELLRANKELSEQSQALNRKLAETNTLLDRKIRELEEQRNLLTESRSALESSFHRSLELCRRILNTFNPLLAAQSKMAADLCESLADQGRFNADERHALQVASRLYDIGLTGIPPNLVAAIQEENADLDEATVKVVRNHTIYGQTLAAYVDPCKLASETIRSHHERYDGAGYPDGLKGEGIPWTARCLSVIVSYVLKVSSGLTHENALEQLLQKSDSDFDPRALQLFLACARQIPFSGNLREVRAEELRPGMHLASDVATPSGLVLYIKGQKLDAETISRLSKQVRTPLSGNRLSVFG